MTVIPVPVISVGDLVMKTGSIFKLVILASKRTLQLSEGSAPLVQKDKTVKLSTLALREIKEGKISFKEINKK